MSMAEIQRRTAGIPLYRNQCLPYQHHQIVHKARLTVLFVRKCEKDFQGCTDPLNWFLRYFSGHHQRRYPEGKCCWLVYRMGELQLSKMQFKSDLTCWSSGNIYVKQPLWRLLICIFLFHDLQQVWNKQLFWQYNPQQIQVWFACFPPASSIFPCGRWYHGWIDNQTWTTLLVQEEGSEYNCHHCMFCGQYPILILVKNNMDLPALRLHS